MTKIIFFLKGKHFQEIEIDLVKWQDDLSFELNFKMREYQVQSNINELKTMYSKAISKSEYDYYFVVTFQSEMRENKNILSSDVIDARFVVYDEIIGHLSQSIYDTDLEKEQGKIIQNEIKELYKKFESQVNG